MKTQETNFACDLTVLSPPEREQFVSTINALFSGVQETRELEKGYSFQFLKQPDQIVNIAKFIERESQCCSFLDFRLDVKSSNGSIWLSIDGDQGTKQFLQAEMDHIQNLELS